MTNKVITQTVIVPGEDTLFAVGSTKAWLKFPMTKEFMVIDYPRIGVDALQTQQGSVIVDTTVKLLVHGNGDVSDSSSYLRSPTTALAGGTVTFPASTPPTLGLGSNYIQVQGVSSLSTPVFYYPGSAQLLFDGRPGQIWELAFRHKCPSNDAGGRTYRIASFGSSTSANFSSTPNKLRIYINSTTPPTLTVEFNLVSVPCVWDLSTTNYNASNLNHILISCDGTTIRLFVNGVVHATTYATSSTYDSTTTATPLAVFTGGDSGGEQIATNIDEIQLKIGGTVTTASFTAPTTEYTGTTGTVFYTASKVIIPEKRVLEFV